ncbi:MAG TPA: hypothetical protein VFX30_11370 [bacterium]|nr:hypothetical protein [bacterium]
MACGPIPLTPQMFSTALTLLGQPASLPAELSVVLNGAQPEMKLEVLCEGGRPTGWTIERYFDTKTPVTSVVPLDDGEVDERASYVASAADGRVAQRLTVSLDAEHRLARYGVEALCSGNNPNAPVCTAHLPTVNGLAPEVLEGRHADWMQTFVPEVEAGGDYLFVSAADYPRAKKDAEKKRKEEASVPPAPSPIPSAAEPAPVPTQRAVAPVPSAPPSTESPKVGPEGGGLSTFDIVAGILGVLGIGGLLASRFLRKPEKTVERRAAEVAEPQTPPPPPKPVERKGAENPDAEFISEMDTLLNELSPPNQNEAPAETVEADDQDVSRDEPDDENRPTRDQENS